MTAGEESLLLSISLSPIASVLTDPNRPDNPIVAANDAFCALTGYSRDEIVGRNCRFLAGKGTEPWLSDRIRQGVAQRRSTLVEILNYKKNGEPFRNAVLVAPIFADDGGLAFFLGSQVELADDVAAPAAVRTERAVSLVSKLSPRQRQILTEMASGRLNKQIAWRLSLSEKTVKMHRALLLERLGAATSADAIRVAVEAGL